MEVNMVKKNLLLFLLCLYPANIRAEDDSPFRENKIRYGKMANIKEFPFMAGVEYLKEFQCVANIISEDWLVSVAHCPANWTDISNNLLIRVGTSFVEQGGTVHHVKSMNPYPSFDKITLDDDILLYQLNNSLKLSRVQNSVLVVGPKFVTKQAQKLTIVGWGLTRAKSELSYILRKATVLVINDGICSTLYKIENRKHNWSYPLESQFCASAAAYATCKGDGGGPGLIGGKLAGLAAAGVNYGTKCRLSYHPTLLTKMSKYYSWIQSLTNLTL